MKIFSVVVLFLSMALSADIENNNTIVSNDTNDTLISIFCIHGKCSWYGKKFDGKRTASGDIFDSSKNTAAHKTLPFGTKIKVTDIQSGKSTIVTVNDRGPYVGSRVLDISKSAAEKLGVTGRGTFDAKLEILEKKEIK